jgi:RES domain-containing protein
MQVFRITRRKWSQNLSGSGVPARWNRSEAKMLYTSSSLALALLEVLVHVKLDQIPDDYVWVKAVFNEGLVQYLREVPEDTAEYGTQWLHDPGGKTVLSVPSVIVPERNFLLNPDHTEFVHIKWGEPQPLQIDSRLTRMAHPAAEPSTGTQTLTPASARR